MSDDRTETYPGGFGAAVAQWERRRKPLSYARGESLPPFGVNLRALALAVVLPPAGELPPGASGYQAKRQELALHFAGKSELALLNGLLIANLRKSRWPRQAPALFHRLWEEMAQELLAELSTRWLISSLITFSDHGKTEAQRRSGQAFSVLFSLMKLYEFERLYSGMAPSQPCGLDKRLVVPLPLQMEPFSIATGGLDVNLLVPMLLESQRDPVIAPLARRLMLDLNADPGTLFRRLGAMKTERLAVKARKSARRLAGSSAKTEGAG